MVGYYKYRYLDDLDVVMFIDFDSWFFDPINYDPGECVRTYVETYRTCSYRTYRKSSYVDLRTGTCGGGGSMVDATTHAQCSSSYM